MPTKPASKGHRQPVQFVNDPDTGKPVDGLRLHKATSIYYSLEPQESGRAKTHYYPKQGTQGVAYLRLAVRMHQAWMQDTELPTTAFVKVEKMDPPATDQFGTELPLIATVDENGLLISGMYVPLEPIARWIHDQIANPATRKDFAALVKIPELVNLERLQPAGLSLPLETVGNMYLNKTPPLHPRYRRDATAFWNEFRETVGVEKVSELTADLFKTYRETVYHNGKNKSPSYVNNRFTLVVSAFRYAQTEGEDTANLTTALGYCRMLRRIRKADVNPQPIEPADFHKLLAAADTKWKAILLLSLNAAYYPVDAAQIRKVSIDLNKKTLCETRTKTGVPRIAVLWDRTVEAIRQYQAEQPHDLETLFISETGNPFTPKHLARYFREELAQKRAKVLKISFNQIRDGAQTAAIEGGADEQHAEMLLGHRAGGTKDNYTKRKPSMVADACQAIERHYFPASMPSATASEPPPRRLICSERFKKLTRSDDATTKPQLGNRSDELLLQPLVRQLLVGFASVNPLIRPAIRTNTALDSLDEPEGQPPLFTSGMFADWALQTTLSQSFVLVGCRLFHWIPPLPLTL